MPYPNLRRWLHRVGYATTIIVAGELAVATYFAIPALHRQLRIQAAEREETRTHEEPLMLAPDEYGYHAKSLVPKLPFAGGSAPYARFLFVSDAWKQASFGLMLVQPTRASPGLAFLTTRPRVTDPGRMPSLDRIQFVMPREATIALLDKVERLVTGWPGKAFNCLDGDSEAFELRRAGKVLSGRGSSCIDHYSHIEVLTLNRIRPFVSAARMPHRLPGYLERFK